MARADDETRFRIGDEPATLVSVTLGAARTMIFLRRQEQRCRISLGRGDVLLMGGQLQQFFLHRVVPGDVPRVNLTFRWVRHHDMACARPLYPSDPADELTRVDFGGRSFDLARTKRD